MATLVIDTLRLTGKLKSHGFSEQQAVGITEALQEIDLSGLATKADTLALKNDLLAVKNDLEMKISELKADIFKWIPPLMLGQTVLIVGLIKLLLPNV